MTENTATLLIAPRLSGMVSEFDFGIGALDGSGIGELAAFSCGALFIFLAGCVFFFGLVSQVASFGSVSSASFVSGGGCLTRSGRLWGARTRKPPSFMRRIFSLAKSSLSAMSPFAYLSHNGMRKRAAATIVRWLFGTACGCGFSSSPNASARTCMIWLPCSYNETSKLLWMRRETKIKRHYMCFCAR